MVTLDEIRAAGIPNICFAKQSGLRLGSERDVEQTGSEVDFVRSAERKCADPRDRESARVRAPDGDEGEPGS